MDFFLILSNNQKNFASTVVKSMIKPMIPINNKIIFIHFGNFLFLKSNNATKIMKVNARIPKIS